MTKTPETTKTAIAHGNYVRGSASKVRRVLDQIRGRSYRDALIMLEFMPYRSTDPITKVLRSAVANAEHNLGMDPSTLVISSAWANSGPVMKRYRPRELKVELFQSKNRLAILVFLLNLLLLKPMRRSKTNGT